MFILPKFGVDGLLLFEKAETETVFQHVVG